MKNQPDQGPWHRLSLMLTVLCVLFLCLSVFAYAWGGEYPWSGRTSHDSLADDAAELLRDLRQEGMDCQRRSGRRELFDCTYRAPGSERGAGLRGAAPWLVATPR